MVAWLRTHCSVSGKWFRSFVYPSFTQRTLKRSLSFLLHTVVPIFLKINGNVVRRDPYAYPSSSNWEGKGTVASGANGLMNFFFGRGDSCFSTPISFGFPDFPRPFDFGTVTGGEWGVFNDWGGFRVKLVVEEDVGRKTDIWGRNSWTIFTESSAKWYWNVGIFVVTVYCGRGINHLWICDCWVATWRHGSLLVRYMESGLTFAQSELW